MEKFKAIRFEYADGAVVTVQWLPLLNGEWPYGEEKIHTVRENTNWFIK